MTHTVTLVLGLPGAGKTEWIRLYGSVSCINNRFINLDLIRSSLPGINNLKVNYWPLFEASVLSRAVSLLNDSLIVQRNVSIDESFTSLWPVEQIVNASRHYGAGVNMVVVDTPADVCWQRRQASGFPEAEFHRKVREWTKNRADILALADEVKLVTDWGKA